MSFGGGGGGQLTNHRHDPLIPLDGGSLATNSTSFGLANESLLVSDGANVQELSIGVDAQVLGISGGSPTWITNTSSPLIKISKTFADINLTNFDIDIYTLPSDAALVNIWTDITTVFDLSTAVTVGDSIDDNGWVEATNWTAGTGLTNATRGAYVTAFQTMRSTTGTTEIKAYGFTEVAGTVFIQNSGGGGITISNGGAREEVAQQFNAGHVLIGETVKKCSFYLSSGIGSPTGDIYAYIRQADGTVIQQSSNSVDASTLGAITEYEFNFTPAVISTDDMLTCCLDNGTGGGNTITVTTGGGAMTNGTLWKTATCGTNYVAAGAEQLRMTATYGTSTSDTQGEVDFYLQVVD
jgi:hypothetical protein